MIIYNEQLLLLFFQNFKVIIFFHLQKVVSFLYIYNNLIGMLTPPKQPPTEHNKHYLLKVNVKEFEKK